MAFCFKESLCHPASPRLTLRRHSAQDTSCRILKCSALSPRLFPKVTEITTRVLKTVSPLSYVEISLICHFSHKNIIKNPVDSMRAFCNSGGVAQERLTIRPISLYFLFKRTLYLHPIHSSALILNTVF